MKNKLLLLVFLGFYLGLSSCANTNTYGEGKELYEENCANCHIEDGSGVGELIPPLAKSDYLKKVDLDIACIIRYGLKGKITVNGIEYEHEMPPHKKLSEVEIANIANYIHNSWGNKREFIQLEDIKNKLKSCE
jgi:mono/diheme cytochrome c family protein